MNDKTAHASGKRKRAIARATITEGKGIVRINKVPLDEYNNEPYRLKVLEPLVLAGNISKTINIDVNVYGGGFSGQAQAARLAIARAISEYTKDEKLKETFEEYDRNLVVADTRRKEVRKPNRSKARAKRQKSYR